MSDLQRTSSSVSKPDDPVLDFGVSSQLPHGVSQRLGFCNAWRTWRRGCCCSAFFLSRWRRPPRHHPCRPPRRSVALPRLTSSWSWTEVAACGLRLSPMQRPSGTTCCHSSRLGQTTRKSQWYTSTMGLTSRPTSALAVRPWKTPSTRGWQAAAPTSRQESPWRRTCSQAMRPRTRGLRRRP